MAGKGQTSVEQILVVTIATFLLVPLTGVLYYYSRGTMDSIADSQIEEIGENLIYHAGLIHGYGYKSRMLVEMNLPSNIKNITASDRMLEIEYRSNSGNMTYLRALEYELKTNFTGGDISPGKKKFLIQSNSKDNNVTITIYRNS